MSRSGKLYMAWCWLFITVPILVVCGSALNGGRSMLFPPKDPTLARFAEFFEKDSVWVESLQNSLLIAFFSASLAVCVAWPIAYRLWKSRNRFSVFLSSVASLPFVLPPIVFGVGLSFFWVYLGLLGSFWVGVVSHAILHLALPLVTISIGLNSIDRSHLDAASTMGATEPVILRTLVIPQTIPYTLSGFLFAVILSFNEFIVMFFVSASSYSTVTLQIFNSLRNGFTPTMAVAAIVFILSSIVLFGLIGRMGDLPNLMGAQKSGAK